MRLHNAKENICPGNNLHEPNRDALSGHIFKYKEMSSITDPNHKTYQKMMILRMFFIFKLTSRTEKDASFISACDG